MSLQVSYRPSTFEEMVGNKEAIESIKSVINRDKPPSTYLFTGPGGVGKTTAAGVESWHAKVSNDHRRRWAELYAPSRSSDEAAILP